MSSPLDRFYYDTFDVQDSPTGTIRRPGHALGALAAVKIPFKCRACDKEHEAWTILVLPSGCYLSFAPVFLNLDDTANCILDIINLVDWATAGLEQIKGISRDLVAAIHKNGGYPLALLASEESFEKHGVRPGTTGYNGFPRQ